MRMMLRVSIPVETGNAAAVKGSLISTIQQILADLRPEAAYFSEDNGERTVFIIFDMKDSSQLPAVAEPWFLAFNGRVTARPVMSLQDLTEGSPAMQLAIKAYGKAVA